MFNPNVIGRVFTPKEWFSNCKGQKLVTEKQSRLPKSVAWNSSSGIVLALTDAIDHSPTFSLTKTVTIQVSRIYTAVHFAGETRRHTVNFSF